MAPKALVVPSPDRPLSERFASRCEQWAGEVGWQVTDAAAEAEAVIVGPGAALPAEVTADALVVDVVAGRGADGFRWALRSAAFARQWPPTTTVYGPQPENVVDVRAGGDDRTAVLLHGGFWLEPWRRDLMDGVAVDLARRGWTTFNAEYRRSGSGGGWPESAEDAVAVVSGVHGAAGMPVVVVGHSAGAHLALCAAAVLGAEVVERVVSLAGICDLPAARRERLGGGAVDTFLGAHPATEADPRRWLPLRVPLTIAHASGDPLVPYQHSASFVAAALAAGDTVSFLDFDDDDHFALIDPFGAWREVAATL